MPVAFPTCMSYPFVRNPIRSAPVPKPGLSRQRQARQAGKSTGAPVAVRVVLAALIALMASGLLTGCYTQLYTRGYAERTAAYPEYSRAPRAPSDTAAPDTGTVGDSGLAAGRERDTLYAPPATVVVNNYYRESPYYRGYLINDWDYPSFSFGIYSTRYRDYSSPFWWNDPWYRAGGGYHTGYHGHHGGHRGDHGGYIPPAGGGGTTGPYQSDKRIFTPEPDHPELRKGRRSYEAPPAVPAPKYSGESDPSSSSSSSASPSSGSAGSSNSSSSSASSDQEEHPSLKKGRRR
jgi:hypothetical protein